MIKRGTNECGIEDEVVAGLPSTKNLIKKNVNENPVEYAAF